MPMSDTVRHSVWRNGQLSARLGQPVTACPFAQSTDEQRALARVWVTGYMAVAPPPPNTVDFGGADNGTGS